jgi:TPR repeat protein
MTRIRSIRSIALACFGCVALVACSAQRSAQEAAHAKGGPETGRLLGSPEKLLPIPSAEQLTQYKVAAYAGSGTAANALSVFYSKAAPGGDAELYWTMIGAENGDAVAQYNLGTLYLRKDQGHYSLQRATYWLNKSAAQGSIAAKDMLQDVAAGRPVP